MKKTMLVLLCTLLISTNVATTPMPTNQCTAVLDNKYANFREAYSHIRKWEGNYGWHVDDPGGETYAGIARSYNKDWFGWFIIDRHKEDTIIAWNQKIELVEFWATDYYLTAWLDEGWDKLENQKVANYLFDYRNTGYVYIKHIKQELYNQGFDSVSVSKHNRMNPELIVLLNKANADSLIKNVRNERINFYKRASVRHVTHARFLRGWLNRAIDG